MKTFPALIFSLFFLNAHAQEPEINPDSVVIKLTLTTRDDKTLETLVSFEDLLTHKIKKYKTNKGGKTTCTLSTGANYHITIKESNDSYDYNIPDFAISPVLLTFKFSINEKATSSVGIRILNNKDVKEINLHGKEGIVASGKISDNVIYIDPDAGEEYSISLPGVTIRNNTIKLLPESQSYNYVLDFTDKSHAELILLKNTEAVFEVIYQNLYGTPVKGETITIKGTRPGAEYKLKTGINGNTFAIVPANDKYKVALKYFGDVFELYAGKQDTAILTNTVILKYPSPAEYEKQKEDEAKRVKIRDSLYVVLEKKKEKKEFVTFSIPENLALTDVVNGLQANTAYFKTHNIEVCEILKRNAQIWKSKMIVTDVTGSMYPYIQQVALWHLLELMNRDRSDYIFFNDGDNQQDNLKVIGKTGGIYLNLKADPDSVLNTIKTAMNNGSGGDSPENDIEALLEATKYTSGNTELVLIADHLSPVKDIELLNQLKIPVRVILCGAMDGYAHSDYLQIAYKTGGSIHTIEADITNLASLHNEETITIGGTAFIFMNGRFFPLIKKM